MIQLRDYQEDLVRQTRGALMSGSRSPPLVSPVGSGKTVMFSYFTSRILRKGKRCLLLAHRDELLDQISETLAKFEVPHSFIAAGRSYNKNDKAHVGSVMTVVNRLHKIPKPDVIIVDEAHHCTKKSTWGKVLDYFDCWKIGVTATPKRLSGEALGDIFDEMILGPDTAELISRGHLSKYKLFVPSTIDVSGIQKRAGDYSKKQLAEASDNLRITGSAIREYEQRARGKRGVAFCVSVEHAKNVAKEFRSHGYNAVWIEGNFAKEIRRTIIQDFRDGKIDVLTSCDIISEGFDLPAIECGIMLRPTHSLSLWIQQCGRALRTYPGKNEAIILDHAGNALRHGLPDQEREWSLEGKGDKKDGDSAPPVKICPSCFASQFVGKRQCGFCGFEFDIVPREVEHVDGELVEVDAAMIQQKRRKEQGQAESLEELYQIGLKRGYKHARAWAKHVFNARQRKKVFG